jgi:uncharacterized membrane protein
MSQVQTSELGNVAGRGTLEQDDGRAERTPGSQQSRTFEGAGEWHEPDGCSARGQNVGDLERAVSVAAGIGLATVGLVRGRWDGLLLSALGAGLVWRGYSGRCQCYAALGINTAKHNPAIGVPAGEGVKVERSIKINRSPEELYRFWRQLDNLPRVMSHVKQVEPTDSQRSHWVAKGPLGKDVEWDAEIINERENKLIAWRSIPGGDIDTAGSVHFNRSPDGGTELTLSMKYNPPTGKVGAQIAEWLGDGLEQKLDEDLHKFKTAMESGTAHGTPVGQM